MVSYREFLEGKTVRHVATGITDPQPVNPLLFDFQRDIVRWALRKGRAAIFADCGMGNTFMQLEWARQIPGRVLILAPLAVAPQTVREGRKLGIDVTYSRKPTDAQISITNYEMLEHFTDEYAGVALDESSILKSYDGKFRTAVIERFQRTPFRLACTATPAPNDFMELGNHAEFLGTLTRTEMLSTFFVHDGGDTSKWRLKGHAESDFWRWVCSWAVMLRKPSDLGYDDERFTLPPIEFYSERVDSNVIPTDTLFACEAQTLQERQRARADSTEDRCRRVAEIVATKPNEQWLIWCNLNVESTTVAKLIPDAVEVTGSDSEDKKESTMLGFADGQVRVMVSKPSICGFGMNFQSCANVVFLGLSDSYEQFYQAVRRCWRFGQRNVVHCYIVTSTLEGAVVENIQRKERDAARMAEEMVKHMHELNERELHGTVRRSEPYIRRTDAGRDWTMHLGDSIEVIREFPDNCIHYSIFSPPFASLYTYSATERDMGNCRTHAEFYAHFRYLARELYRVLKPGRLLSFHAMDLPRSKERDGVIGLFDFPSKVRDIMEDVGFIYHSRVCIWKDPVTAMQRTKAIGLLHKQLKKDSCLSRQGIADYLITVRKPGTNDEPVSHTNETFPVQLWQRYASPVWMDVNPNDTLTREEAREEKDERHICALQLGVIERALMIWSNEGDTVLSPFAGIGSEGYESVRHGRKFIGVELKESYWRQACINLRAAEQQTRGLFDVSQQTKQEAACSAD